MSDSYSIEDMAKKLYSALPSSLQKVEAELQAKFKDILQAAFAKLDLVTRAEFDVQVKVLQRTRQKVEALQQELDLLKEHLSSK